ncbi:type II toxin-antitoxin system death-on-curing family toxin, partial [Burkholderia pseudomallei]
MKKTNLRHQSAIRTISSDEVLSIHELLALDMANSGDAISPAGVKNEVLLHSAVGRQTTGFGDKLKYNTVEANAATLCYGICCNHPFHNGNKRTALVAMLSHLDRNDRTFDSSVSQDNLDLPPTNRASRSLVKFVFGEEDEHEEALYGTANHRVSEGSRG